MGFEVICGDALAETMRLAARGVRADACITDPPFNAGKDFDNDNLSPEGFRLFCQGFASAVKVLAPTNLLVEVGKGDSIMRGVLDAAFTYRYALCLNYTNSMRNGAVGFANWGLVLWYGGKCFNRYKDRLDAALIDSRGEFQHESPKMVEHYRHLVRMFTPEGGTVVDPFCGSGTTGVACALEGRNFIGVDVDPYNCEVTEARIKRALGKPCDIPRPMKSDRVLPLFAGANANGADVVAPAPSELPGQADSGLPGVTFGNNGSVARRAEVVQA